MSFRKEKKKKHLCNFSYTKTNSSSICLKNTTSFIPTFYLLLYIFYLTCSRNKLILYKSIAKALKCWKAGLGLQRSRLEVWFSSREMWDSSLDFHQSKLK